MASRRGRHSAAANQKSTLRRARKTKTKTRREGEASSSYSSKRQKSYILEMFHCANASIGSYIVSFKIGNIHKIDLTATWAQK